MPETTCPENDTISMDYATILASSIHDMKNSLSMLLGSLDHIIDTQENGAGDKEKVDYSHMRYEGQRLNNNLLQLLALYRVHNKQYNVNVDHIFVIDFLEDALIQHQGMFDHKKIDLQINCDADLQWYFDQDIMSGVITNVINNLYRYTKDKVIIEAYIENDYLVINVKDNGPGYPTELQFSQTDNQQGIDFNSGSTGLGLYFARVIANLHKKNDRAGYIITNNTGINGGGCFSIYLP